MPKFTAGDYQWEIEETMRMYGISMRSGPVHLVFHVGNPGDVE